MMNKILMQDTIRLRVCTTSVTLVSSNVAILKILQLYTSRMKVNISWQSFQHSESNDRLSNRGPSQPVFLPPTNILATPRQARYLLPQVGCRVAKTSLNLNVRGIHTDTRNLGNAQV